MNNSVSIGDFAEQILAQEAAGNPPAVPAVAPTPSYLPTGLNEQAPDISNIEVPRNFVNSILENKETETVIKEVEDLSTPSELQDLISEVKELLTELRQVLHEVTAVGSLGVNMAGPGKEEQEDDDFQKSLSKILKKRKKAR